MRLKQHQIIFGVVKLTKSFIQIKSNARHSLVICGFFYSDWLCVFSSPSECGEFSCVCHPYDEVQDSYLAVSDREAQGQEDSPIESDHHLLEVLRDQEV